MSRVRKGGGNEDRRINLDEDVICRLFLNGGTAAEIATQLGCSTFPVKKMFRRLGLKRPAKRRPGVGTGPTNSAWKGGRRVRRDGYVLIWTMDGERLEHRVVMECHLGRLLNNDEIVHHRDGDKGNNDPANLEVMSQSDHARIHAAEMHMARNGNG